MTLLEHIYAVKELISKGPSTRDFRYSDEVIKHFLITERANLLKNKINKYHHISNSNYQTICVDLEKSDISECCDTPICVVLKSKTKLPETVTARFGELMKVTDLVGNSISYLDATSNKYSKYALSPATIGYYIQNGYLIIILNTHLEKVLVTALFLDNSASCTEGCDPLAETFFIDNDLVSSLYTAVVQKLLLVNTKNDTKNDGRDNIL